MGVKSNMRNKKGLGMLNQLPMIAMVIVVFILVLGAGLLASDSFLGTMTAGTTAHTATNDSITALGTLGSTWANPIITMAAIGIMIGVIFSAFAFVKLR